MTQSPTPISRKELADEQIAEMERRYSAYEAVALKPGNHDKEYGAFCMGALTAVPALIAEVRARRAALAEQALDAERGCGVAAEGTVSDADYEAVAEAMYDVIRDGHSAWQSWKDLPIDTELSARWMWVKLAKTAVDKTIMLAEAQNELFDLRCRAGCGPDQEGPDVWQQLIAMKKDFEIARTASRMFEQACHDWQARAIKAEAKLAEAREVIDLSVHQSATGRYLDRARTWLQEMGGEK